uniref:Uncharacterized protein n=1 Tax=Ananas comosus var. bracteatus TaxID=296719 RepID=A0A6V7Q8H0_ANACO|nr:unnamed protein product [Ananas comosus var. bracteatus]
MAGLLAWAADVVGGGPTDDAGDDYSRLAIPVVFTAEQQARAAELDARAASLRRSIRDLRLRIPPRTSRSASPTSTPTPSPPAPTSPSNSTPTPPPASREIALQEENAAYEKAIANCHQKIEEKLHEADLLQSKLKELNLIAQKFKGEFEIALKEEEEASRPESSTTASNSLENVTLEIESSRITKLKDLEERKKELRLLEEAVQRLEIEWSLVQQESAKKPSPAQREKLLEKQLHSLIEQLTAKQAQAENLMTEIHAKEKDLERLNGLKTNLDSGVAEVNAARNRFGRSFSVSGGAFEDRDVKAFRRGVRTDSQQKLMLLRSAFVIYILALHVIVFIKISF